MQIRSPQCLVSQMDDSPMVIVIAVTYNSAALIPEFVTSLRDSVKRTSYKLVMVDNASTDDTIAQIEEHAPEAVLVRSERNLGYGGGINMAMRAAQPQGPVLVTNPDLRLHPGALEILLDALSDPTIGIVVPQLLDDRGNISFSLRRDPRPLRVLGEAVLGGRRAGRYDRLGEMVTVSHSYETPGTADWATGACMLLSAECVRRVGDWNESFFLYSEETDYALRARDAGLAVYYQPRAQATHRGGDAHVSSELFELLTMNRWRLYRSRHGRAAGAAFRAALVADAIPRALLGRRPARAALKSLLSPGADPHLGAVRRTSSIRR